jgi:DNA-binding MarR family transcriptional regulator
MSRHPRHDEWLQALLAPGARSVSLDEVAEVIGAAAVTPPDIEALIDELEKAGCPVGEEAKDSARELLAIVLRAARELRTTLGRNPTTPEIAAHCGLTPSQVKSALLFAQVLQR